MAVSSFDSQHPSRASIATKSEQAVTQGRRLQRTLSPLETWSFGLTGHVGWIGSAPVLHAALGLKLFGYCYPP